MEVRIIWLGHASFRIESEKGRIYIDPWKLKKYLPADYILVTHSHYDHLSLEDIEKIRKEKTVIIGPADVARKVPGTRIVKPGESIDLKDIIVEVHAAYNTKKEFHPVGNNWVGFVVDIDRYRIYHSGDTDIIPEMKNLKEIDVALLSVGGTYTMDPSEAARAVSMIRPKKAIPIHWGEIIGDMKSAKKFKKMAGCEVEILSPER